VCRALAAIASLGLVVSVAAGCHFSITPVNLDAAAGSPPITPASPSPDMAPPQQQQPPPNVDMAVPPPGVLDMARPRVVDMAKPDDLMSPCVHVTESFAADPTARWTLQGNATYDANNQRLQLTSPDNNAAGSAFYNEPLYTVAFDVRFNFRINDGGGADGMAFVLAHSGSTAGLGPFGNGVANTGYGLGYYGMDGFAVELDTFQNIGNGDPDNNHVGFMRTADGTHLLTGTPPTPALHSSTVRLAHVRFTGTHITVEIDGTKTIDADLPALTNFNPGSFYFGLTGASGGITDRHTVTNFDLTVGPANICF
jgi:hypothetical protein